MEYAVLTKTTLLNLTLRCSVIVTFSIIEPYQEKQCTYFCFLKIAEWLKDGERPAVCLKMDESHRPVKLQKVVLGFPCNSNQTEFKFDLYLNYKIASVIQTYSDQKPSLVV